MIIIKKIRTLAHCQSSDEGPTIKSSAVVCQITLTTQLMEPNYLALLQPMQYRSNLKKLPPSIITINNCYPRALM